MEVWIRPSWYYLGRRDKVMPYPVPGWMWDRAIGQQLYADHMRFMRRVDELGFDGVLFTEHHYGPNGGLTPSPIALLAAASQVTERIKLVTMGIPLALYPHPVRVAEELALVDNLSNGRLVVGLISAGAPNLYAYNLAAAEERPLHHEAYDLIVRAWTDENPFEWHGEHYDYQCVSILPRPVQVPHPPVWTVASSEQSLQWAAQHRISLMSSGPNEEAATRLNYYQQYAEKECGWTPTTANRGIAREFFIGRTKAEVEARAAEIFNQEGESAYGSTANAPELAALHRESRAVRTPVVQGAGPAEGRVRRSADAVQSGSYLAGDPDTIADQIVQQQAICNAGVLVIRPELGARSLDEVAEGLELFAQEVLTTVQKL
jgi:alkanesulfonate monooxygenase SsuD/methylene tetrahydromethanopterin reductase-like flavin-dependent oxidoreductase (luciferase family)